MKLNFDIFYAWVNEHVGIDLAAYKEKQLQRRIATVMKQSGVHTLEEYALLIGKDEHVKQQFLNYITINVTEFYRNKELFEEFERMIVEYLKPTFGALNMWSAACSIGSEPYSMAMISDKHHIQLEKKILATDIDEPILERAKAGIYKEHELKNISLIDKQRYFKKEDAVYILEERIKQQVRFQKHDLILGAYEKNFHAIVCRNVTIYFKNEVKEKIYQQFSDSLVQGGVFFTGATETIYRPNEFGFKKIAPFIYQKM